MTTWRDSLEAPFVQQRTASDSERVKAWLARGVDLEVALVQAAGEVYAIERSAEPRRADMMRESLRTLMSCWVRSRDLLAATAAAADFIRIIAPWVRDATLVDIMFWACGPWRWSPP